MRLSPSTYFPCCLTIVLGFISLVYYFLVNNASEYNVKESDLMPFYKSNNSHFRVGGDKEFSIVWPTIQELPGPSFYPKFKSLLDVVTQWNPDQVEVPPVFVETLQHFNYSDPKERAMAERYRDAEMPFKMYGIADFETIGQKWSDEDYLIQGMNSISVHVEMSNSNHFMFWSGKPLQGGNYKSPTDLVDLKFAKWLKLAKLADKNKLDTLAKHFYFMTGSTKGDRHKQSSNFIARDLTPFSTLQNNFFITNVNANKGIQCRFGMRGIIAESHYDSGKNMIAMMKGAKRYIINPPKACKKLGIITDIHHPSFRHSVIDWSDLRQAKSRGFENVDAIDTIVRQGEVLYIPSYWFHYVVSLNYSIQCNSRSGAPPLSQGQAEIDDCMMSDENGNEKKKKKNNKNNKNKKKKSSSSGEKSEISSPIPTSFT